jgi:hypothetical protein
VLTADDDDVCVCLPQLNPRLQVEHPCSEWITHTNIPALQVRPLYYLLLQAGIAHRPPRHPTSFGASGDDLRFACEMKRPSLQVNIAMGIPLGRIPDIRGLYQLPPFGLAPLDFSVAKQVSPELRSGNPRRIYLAFSLLA